ncbi:PHP domain-like protein [Backusella circina FSU 941]|nr:PHP domain-like protein [Backusella circina FSU 941]
MSSIEADHPIRILTRVTIITNDVLSTEALTDLRQNYDLIALRTNNMQVFKQACQSYDIDIISLYPNERLEFELEQHDIELAMSRHVYFELCYSPSIRDNQARTMTLQLAKQLIEYTKGQKLIISSEAEIVSELRLPGDIFYFAKALGLPNDKAKFTTEKNGEQLLYYINKRKQLQ